jgi:hypothetical protein
MLADILLSRTFFATPRNNFRFISKASNEANTIQELRQDSDEKFQTI